MAISHLAREAMHITSTTLGLIRNTLLNAAHTQGEGN